MVGIRGLQYAQEAGVCRGFSVAPILSEVFLYFADQNFKDAHGCLKESPVADRYVEDIVFSADPVHAAPKNLCSE